MADQNVRSGMGRTTVDYIKLASFALFALAVLSFVVGLYYDLIMPGEAIIPVLSIASDPANSGFFVLSIILLVLGLLVGKLSNMVEEYQSEKIDQTQEWTVDIGNN